MLVELTPFAINSPPLPMRQQQNHAADRHCNTGKPPVSVSSAFIAKEEQQRCHQPRINDKRQRKPPPNGRDWTTAIWIEHDLIKRCHALKMATLCHDCNGVESSPAAAGWRGLFTAEQL